MFVGIVGLELAALLFECFEVFLVLPVVFMGGFELVFGRFDGTGGFGHFDGLVLDDEVEFALGLGVFGTVGLGLGCCTDVDVAPGVEADIALVVGIGIGNEVGPLDVDVTGTL